jgi:signal transduction histidine kinase
VGRWFGRTRQRLAYSLIAISLAVTVVAAVVGGVRLHHAALIQRQTLRTQRLAEAALELAAMPGGSPAELEAAFRDVEAHDSGEGARLRSAYSAYLTSVRTQRGTQPYLRRLESRIDVEVARQARATHTVDPAARAALIAAVLAAAILVALLIWQFELERRAGRIDRDNAARAVELIRLRDELVAIVSHELRTPLSSILGYLELISDEGIDNLTLAQRSHLAVVERSADRLNDLVGDLLVVAESDRGPLRLELVDVDIRALSDHAAEAARPAADTREISLRVEHGAGGAVRGDPLRLAQMLDNLVSNAVKFTPEGGRVTIRTATAHGQALFEVSDTGAGVSASERARLFEPFYRSEKAIASAVPGTGLGLTVTKAIVDAHRGRIEVESAPAAGTTVRVRIPTG